MLVRLVNALALGGTWLIVFLHVWLVYCLPKRMLQYQVFVPFNKTFTFAYKCYSN